MTIIDAHTHAFPDSLAEKALNKLHEKTGPFRAALDGTISSLLESMDFSGVEQSIVCSIATKPDQFESILSWCESIRSRRIIPLPSVHPESTDIESKIREIKERGFKGIKLHPLYQDFFADEERLFPIYEGLEKYGLILEIHSGYDIGYPYQKNAAPERILAVHTNFPALKLVATHLGGWRAWEDVEKYLVGTGVYFETSFTLDEIAPETRSAVLSGHSRDRIMMGSDSPWRRQEMEVDLIMRLDIDEEAREKMLGLNAERLLNSV